MKIVNLFFGSFNPIHIGHLVIANKILEESDASELWFVVSPHNPFKNKSTLLSERDRIYLVNLSIEGNYKFKASDIEFNLPKPNYTINTLVYLKEKYPKYTFNIIMGSDNILHFHKWKNFKQIISDHKIIIYPRDIEDIEIKNEDVKKANIEIIKAPLLNISATYIRQQIKDSKSIKYLVTNKSFEYIESMKFYRN